jgi:hypothetical protein
MRLFIWLEGKENMKPVGRASSKEFKSSRELIT